MVDSKIFKSSLIYFISAFFFLLLKIFSSLNWFLFLGEYGGLIVNGFIQLGLMFLIPLGLYMIFHKKTLKQTFLDFKFTRIGKKTVLTSFAFGFVMFLGVIVVSALCASILHLFGYNNPFSSSASDGGNIWDALIIPIIASAVLPGFCEEFINRGLLLNGLIQMSPRRAIFFSALLFGLLHYNINQAIYAFGVGLLLGTITYMTRSIWPAIIMHFTNNFCSTYFSYAYTEGVFGQSFYKIVDLFFEGNMMTVFLKIALLIAVVISCGTYLLQALYKQTARIRLNEKLQNVAAEYFGEGKACGTGMTYEIDDSNKQKSVLAQNFEGEIYVKLKDTIFDDMRENKEEKPLLDKLLPVPNKRFVINKKETLFLYTTLFMTALLTLFTLIWGFL